MLSRISNVLRMLKKTPNKDDNPLAIIIAFDTQPYFLSSIRKQHQPFGDAGEDESTVMMKSFVKERINSEIVYGQKNRCICISMGPANSFSITNSTNLIELINHVKDAEAEQGTQLFSNGQFGQTSFLRKPRRTKKDTQ